MSVFIKAAGLSLLCAALAGCDSEQPDAASDLPTQPLGFEQIIGAGPGTMFASFDTGLGYKFMQDTAKAACLDEDICEVIIFRSNSILPTKFPMTNREVAESVGNYTLNRSTGEDELLARCPDVAGTPADKCMAAS